MNKKGFTLVELLAVIVILAIILAIAIPSITSLIENSKKGSFESNVKMIAAGIEYKILEAQASGAAAPYTVGATTDVDSNAASWGGKVADYDHIYITSLTPVTVEVQTVSGSQFGAYKAVGATRNTSGTVTKQ